MDLNNPAKSNEFYEAVGRALSAWQPIEVNLALLFVELVGASNFKAAFASFGAAVSLNARLQMLEAAADVGLEGEVAKTCRHFVQRVKRASANRNKLAHWMYNAVVDDHGGVDVFLADVRKGPVGPDASSVRLKDIREWVEEWEQLLLEAVSLVASSGQLVGLESDSRSRRIEGS